MKIWFLILVFVTFSFAEFDVNVTDDNETNATLIAENLVKERAKKIKIDELENSLVLNSALLEEYSIWLKHYSNYLTYLQVKKSSVDVERVIRKYSKKSQTPYVKEKLSNLHKKELVLEEQLTLLSNYSNSAFGTLMHPEDIGETPSVDSPFEIIKALSYTKILKQQSESYSKKVLELQKLHELIEKRHKILTELFTQTEDDKYTLMLSNTSGKEQAISNALSTLKTTADIYGKRIDATILNVNKSINKQGRGILDLLLIIVGMFVVAMLIKAIVKRYITDNERYYMANKVINFINLSLVVIVIFFTYMGNVDNLVTVLGFVSAGIAIAMKDWFMSLMGWLVILLGGSVHVGDRIRVERDGMIYVGDILDISPLRMTMQEDITLTSYSHNRRAGRIIFIPNNYIFTSMIANYTHGTLKTVWDGVDITITFDSNSKKAIYIAKEITRKYAKGYTDMTRKQLNSLRDRYSLKNTNVEPRIYSFIEPNGIKISAWYLTNSYATLTLRSTISMELINAYREEEDIAIAYPTQTMLMHKVDSYGHHLDIIPPEEPLA